MPEPDEAPAGAPPQATPAEENEPINEPKHKRKLSRNATELQVERIMQDKLAAFDPVGLQTATRKVSGKSPRDYIADEIRARRHHKRNISSQFWHRFFAEFGLGSSRFGDLSSADDPGAGEDVCDGIMYALMQAHHETPPPGNAIPGNSPGVRARSHAGVVHLDGWRQRPADREGLARQDGGAHRRLAESHAGAFGRCLVPQ